MQQMNHPFMQGMGMQQGMQGSMPMSIPTFTPRVAAAWPNNVNGLNGMNGMNGSNGAPLSTGPTTLSNDAPLKMGGEFGDPSKPTKIRMGWSRFKHGIVLAMNLIFILICVIVLWVVTNFSTIQWVLTVFLGLLFVVLSVAFYFGIPTTSGQKVVPVNVANPPEQGGNLALSIN
jgi:hypothetical protein